MTVSYFNVLDVNRCMGRKMCCSFHSDKSLCNDKFLLNVGNSEIYKNKSFPTTENAQIVVNRCAT